MTQRFNHPSPSASSAAPSVQRELRGRETCSALAFCRRRRRRRRCGGNLIALQRADGTIAAGALVSYGKARTAAQFKHATAFFEDTIRAGRTPLLALADFTPLQGGVPIIVRNQLLGAIGVSGATDAAQDEEPAIAGVNAILAAIGGELLAPQTGAQR